VISVEAFWHTTAFVETIDPMAGCKHIDLNGG
jgi:hypothetical protein